MELNWPGGLTDNLPSTLSGTQIFRQWLQVKSPSHYDDPYIDPNGSKYECHVSDGTFVLWVGTIDFDYKMAYLLEIRTNDDVDWLMCFERHAGGRHISVQWLNLLCKIGSEDYWFNRVDAHKRFVDFAFAEVEDNSYLNK